VLEVFSVGVGGSVREERIFVKVMGGMEEWFYYTPEAESLLHQGDASVPTPLYTTPAPTRPGTLAPDVRWNLREGRMIKMSGGTV